MVVLRQKDSSNFWDFQRPPPASWPEFRYTEGTTQNGPLAGPNHPPWGLRMRHFDFRSANPRHRASRPENGQIQPKIPYFSTHFTLTSLILGQNRPDPALFFSSKCPSRTFRCHSIPFPACRLKLGKKVAKKKYGQKPLP